MHKYVPLHNYSSVHIDTPTSTANNSKKKKQEKKQLSFTMSLLYMIATNIPLNTTYMSHANYSTCINGGTYANIYTTNEVSKIKTLVCRMKHRQTHRQMMRLQKLICQITYRPYFNLKMQNETSPYYLG